jgi:hypothetical protein
MENKYILGFFDDEEVLMHALEEIKTEVNVPIHEVYSPFPIHGIDDILGYKRTRLTVAAFLFGCCGFTFGLSMQSWMLGIDWPMNIGGKPALAWPDFVPVTFELTVLITALGMVGTFLLASGFFPGAPAKIPDPRVTDDMFCVAYSSDKVGGSKDALVKALKHHGALEIHEKEVEL